jgi:hypothetical protein
VELFHADGQSEQTKLIVTFCNFAKEFKNCELGSELLKHLTVQLSKLGIWWVVVFQYERKRTSLTQHNFVFFTKTIIRLKHNMNVYDSHPGVLL